MLLMAADIISFVTVALATALTRIAALEAELKTSTEDLKDANAAKVSAEKAAKSAETRAKRLKKLWLRLIRKSPSENKLW
jgi:cell division protein FtsL